MTGAPLLSLAFHLSGRDRARAELAWAEAGDAEASRDAWTEAVFARAHMATLQLAKAPESLALATAPLFLPDSSAESMCVGVCVFACCFCFSPRCFRLAPAR